MLLQARLNVRKDLESSGRKGLEDNFHHCGGPVTPVHACFSVRRDLETSFYHCGSTVKLVNVSLRPRKISKSSLHHCGGPVKRGRAV